MRCAPPRSLHFHKQPCPERAHSAQRNPLCRQRRRAPSPTPAPRLALTVFSPRSCPVSARMSMLFPLPGGPSSSVKRPACMGGAGAVAGAACGKRKRKKRFGLALHTSQHAQGPAPVQPTVSVRQRWWQEARVLHTACAKAAPAIGPIARYRQCSHLPAPPLAHRPARTPTRLDHAVHSPPTHRA